MSLAARRTKAQEAAVFPNVRGVRGDGARSGLVAQALLHEK